MADRNKLPIGLRTWERSEKLRAERLYVLNGCSPKEIADKLGREPHAVSNLIWREGWRKRRTEIEDKARAQSESAAIDKAKDFIESVDIQSEELAEGGFKLARSAVGMGDAKAFAMAASGTKTFVQLKRQAAGLDAQQAGANVTINAIFGAPEPRRAEQNVTPQNQPQSIASGDDLETLDFA